MTNVNDKNYRNGLLSTIKRHAQMLVDDKPALTPVEIQCLTKIVDMIDAIEIGIATNPNP